MSTEKTIMVCGDVHGYWSSFNLVLDSQKPSIVLQCGDFGYYKSGKKVAP